MRTIQVSELLFAHLQKAADVAHGGDINAYLHSRFPVQRELGLNPDRTLLERIKEDRYAHCVQPKEKYAVLLSLLHEIDSERFYALENLSLVNRILVSLREDKIHASHATARTAKIKDSDFFFLLPARASDPIDFTEAILQALDYPRIPVIQEVKTTLRAEIDLTILD